MENRTLEPEYFLENAPVPEELEKSEKTGKAEQTQDPQLRGLEKEGEDEFEIVRCDGQKVDNAEGFDDETTEIRCRRHLQNVFDSEYRQDEIVGDMEEVPILLE